MFRSIADFLKVWESDTDVTVKTFRELTDASLAQRATADTRTIGALAWHITCSLGEMMTTAGMPLGHLANEKLPVPAKAAEIADAYQDSAKAVTDAIRANWSDNQLDDELPMYGENWKKGFILYVLLGHQIHHRGQLTMLMRMAGLKVPGAFGPSREEWAAYGMAAPS